EEEELLAEAVDRHGLRFAAVAREVPGRDASSCRRKFFMMAGDKLGGGFRRPRRTESAEVAMKLQVCKQLHELRKQPQDNVTARLPQLPMDSLGIQPTV